MGAGTIVEAGTGPTVSPDPSSTTRAQEAQSTSYPRNSRPDPVLVEGVVTRTRTSTGSTLNDPDSPGRRVSQKRPLRHE